MTTPYSSFAPIDKYQTKEWPMPFSAYAEIHRAPLAYFNIGEAINKASEFLNSENVQKGISATKDIVSTVKTMKPGTSSGTKSSTPGAVLPSQSIAQSWWTTPRIIGVAAGSAVLIAIAIIVIIKLRKK